MTESDPKGRSRLRVPPGLRDHASAHGRLCFRNLTSKSDVGAFTYADPAHPHAVTKAGGQYIIPPKSLRRPRRNCQQVLDFTEKSASEISIAIDA